MKAIAPVLLLLALCPAAWAGDPPQVVTAFVGATLIDGHGGEPTADATVLISEDRILAAGARSEVEIPQGAETVAVAGKFIVPGFVDTHTHFFESGRIHMDPVVPIFDDEITEEADIEWLKARLPYTLSRYLCSGVTTALSLGGPVHIEFGAKRRAAELDRAPRVLVAGGPISNSGLEWVFDGEHAVFAADSEEAMREKVRFFADQGADAIKLGYIGEAMGVDTDVTVDEYAPVLRAAADEAHALGLPVLTHVMTREELEGVIDTDLDAYAHLGFDEPLRDESVREIVKKGIYVAPTIAVFPKWVEVMEHEYRMTPIEEQCADKEVIATYLDYPDSFMKKIAFQLSAWALKFMIGDARPAIGESARRLQAAGAQFVIGSDASHIGTPHGVSVHSEMQLLEAEGVAPSNLIQAATKNAAALLGKLDEFGTVEAGKSADFLVLDRNPLETIHNAQWIHTVVARGPVFAQKTLRAD